MTASKLEKSRLSAALCVIGIAGLAAPLQAQEESAPVSHLDQLKECREQADPALRLACYDAAAGAMIAAEEEGELKIVDRQEVRKTRRSLFGFSLPSLGIFGKGDKEEDDPEDQLNEIETTIAAVGGSHSGGYVIQTAEGAVWRINDVPNRLLRPKVGDRLLIKSGALSSYFIRINNQGGVKATRTR